MSKAVMISIQPKWCELIASRKKTIEVRKTRPKLEVPFKCYIYETRAKSDRPIMLDFGVLDYHGRGKVIGEFVCDYITPFRPRALVCDSEMCKLSQVPVGKLVEYAPDKPFPDDHIYGWHISDLVIYDHPKKLSEFEKPKEYKKGYFDGFTRPPQSWCYVEEVLE